MQPRHLVGREIGAGRVVRVGDEDDAGPLGDPRQKAVDIGGQIALGHRDRGGADRQGADRVHQEAVPAVQHFGAGTGIAALQQRDQLVRARTADNPVRVEAVGAAQRLAQFGGAAVRIAEDVAGERPIGLHRFRARAEGALVRCQPDRPLDPGRLRLASDIGGDIEDARARDRGMGSSHRHNLYKAAAAIPADAVGPGISAFNSCADNGTA